MYVKPLCSGIAVLCLFFAEFVLPSHAQSTEPELRSRLVHRPLYLRGLWRNDDLHFDSNGKLIGNSETAPFTLSGIEIVKVKLEKDRLQLRGHRIGLELDGSTPKRVPLLVGTLWFSHQEEVNIDVAMPASHDLGSVIDAIFVENIADLMPSLPPWWQPYAHKHFLAASVSYDPYAASSTDALARYGHEVVLPASLNDKEPEFNTYAKLLMFKGTALIHLPIDKSGTPSKLSVKRPLGLGLDEQAIEAVRNWLFVPAMRNGRPLAVEVDMEVNFQIIK
jgi:TonB family protein